MPSSIAHVLFDADGVLQTVPDGWFAPAEPYLGDRAEEFVRHLWELEQPTLIGQGDFRLLLADRLRAFGVSSPAEEVLADLWHNIAPDPGSVALVAALRDAGYGVYLGTNQGRHRAAHMRSALGYDDLFAVSCYSYELGAAKPDPRFFTIAAERIGAAPAEIVLVDDSARNLQGARAAGLAAVQWTIADGLDRLLGELAGLGVRP